MVRKTLPSRDLVRQLLSYDADTGEFTWMPRPRETFTDQRTFAVWNTKNAGKPAGGSKKHGYLYISIAHTQYFAHRLAWLVHYGDPVPDHIDHADGKPGNNRIANLRAATQSQNMANSKRRKNNAVGIKGVWRMTSGKFRARIAHEGVAVHLGVFDTVEEAAAAYREGAFRLHGAFARLN